MNPYCTALINAPEKNPEGSYDCNEANKLYCCSITGKECVGRLIDTSEEGPHPMYYTIYKAILDIRKVNLCPARGLSADMQNAIKVQLETSQRQRRVSQLEKELESLKGEIK